MNLEYDEVKNQINLRKAIISPIFTDGLATIYDNPFTAPTMDVPDEMHSDTRETGIMPGTARVVAGSGLYNQLQDKDSTGKRPGQERTEPGLCRMPEHRQKEKNYKKYRCG